MPKLINYFLYGNLYPKTPYISDIFCSNYINTFQIPPFRNIINITNIINVNIIENKTTREKKSNKKIAPQKTTEDIDLIKLFFNIPGNFLNEFKLKEIKVEQNKLNENILLNLLIKKFHLKIWKFI